ncbi:MAG: toprim domain-containing protein [Alphaproteobacteria bacterium]|nr:toprim domain-containing protein [Alphaproteobacteria bacterium]
MTDTHVHVPSALDQFRAAIEQRGITPPDSIESDGKFHRFSSSGRSNDDAGWYVFYDGDIPVGAFGDFRTGDKVKAWAADIGRVLSPSETSSFRQKQAESKIKREAEKAARRAKAKDKASAMLRHSRPAGDDHPYLARKGVKAHRIALWKDLLLVPIIDETQKVQSLQMISGDGGKKFLSGGKMQGCYFPIGSVKDAKTIMIAEGYATAATVHEATGLPVIVAFNAENLVPVAKTIRAQNPKADLVLCADDDFKTKGNPGVTKAAEAAQAVDGRLMVPYFGDNRPDGATDFNDMAAHLGKDAVAGFFTSRLLERDKERTFPTDDDSENDDAEEDKNEEDKEEILYFASPAASSYRPAAAASGPVYVPEPRKHFTEEEFPEIQNIWKTVKRLSASHNESGYHILLKNKHKLVVTRNKVSVEESLLHRPPDEVYVAACEQARQFWLGQMEVNGDNKHRIKAWAYARVYGVQVTNFKPNEYEQAEAEKLIEKIRNAMEPSFSRPTASKAQQTPTPSP